jgi:hypothetical protein
VKKAGDIPLMPTVGPVLEQRPAAVRRHLRPRDGEGVAGAYDVQLGNGTASS